MLLATAAIVVTTASGRGMNLLSRPIGYLKTAATRTPRNATSRSSLTVPTAHTRTTSTMIQSPIVTARFVDPFTRPLGRPESPPYVVGEGACTVSGSSRKGRKTSSSIPA